MIKKMKDIDSSEDGILTSLLRTVLFQTGKINSVLYYINRYIKRGGKRNRATVVKLILDGSITWKSLIFLVFEVFEVKKMKITLELTHEGDIVTTHTRVVTPTSTSDSTTTSDPSKDEKDKSAKKTDEKDKSDGSKK